MGDSRITELELAGRRRTGRVRPGRPGDPRTVAGPQRRWQLGLIVLLALGFLSLGAIEAWRDSPTYDEPVYVSSGLAGLQRDDLSLNDEHPPLGKLLAALPVLLEHPVTAPAGAAGATDEHVYSAAFVRAQRAAGKLRAVDFAARIVPLLECVALALVLYALASELFGGYAGLLSAALWLASPLVLGLGHLDGVDLPFALTVALFSWALLRWMRERGAKRLLALGVAAALAALTNADGLLIIALGTVLVLGLALGGPDDPWRRRLRRALLRAVAFTTIAVAAVWAVYVVLDPSVLDAGLGLLPHPYLEGIRYLAHHDTAPAPSYLLGTAWIGGRWWYWPLSLVVKLPPATLAVLALGPIAWFGLDRARRREAALVTALPAIILCGFDLTMTRDIGVRYLLPVIALWLVAASAAASTPRALVIRVGLALAVLLGVWSTASSFPNSLAWTSPLFGPPYRVATNSSVDWGQDYFLLQSWDRTHPARVAYFGPAGMTVAGARGVSPLLGVPPALITGWVAVSATDLTTTAGLAWLRAYCPIGQLGGTILIYRFTHPPSAQPGPSEPAALCHASASRRISSR